METTEHTEHTEKEEDGFLFKDEGYALLGACFNVYKEKGCGFVEPVYHDCLLVEFDFLKIPFVYEPVLELEYRGRVLAHTYEPDFICYSKIILEIKAVSKLANEHRAQLFNYLKATGLRVGYLMNFGHHPKLEFQRLVL